MKLPGQPTAVHLAMGSAHGLQLQFSSHW